MKSSFKFDQAWLSIEKALITERVKESQINDQNLHDIVEALNDEGVASAVTEYFFSEFEEDLIDNVKNDFWNFFHSEDAHDQLSCVGEAFTALHNHFNSYQSSFECLERIRHISANFGSTLNVDSHFTITTDVKTHAQTYVKAIIFRDTTPHFQKAILDFYSRAFQSFDPRVHENKDNRDEDSEDYDQCSGCEKPKDDCSCAQIIQSFHQLNKQLSDLGLLHRVSGDAVSQLIHQRIQLHIEQTCKGNYETSFLESAEQWIENKVVVWLQVLYDKEGLNSLDCSSDEQSVLPVKDSLPADGVSAHKGRLCNFLYNVYALVHIEEMFEIIIEYPDSEPALLDLKTCLEKTDLRGMLVHSFRSALEIRLLHPGADTLDILTAYISAISALRVLDPTGVLLELVCQPVRKYLRNRDDTVRCIVSSLTEDSNSELIDELIKGQPLSADDSYRIDNTQLDAWQDWNPDPVDADPAKMSSNRGKSDIMSMLVDIYGTKELFVNEYRTLLADRLLTKLDFDTEKEVRYLELLKLRFGESQLHFCEVMLKDVADSKRINTNIHNREKKQRETKIQNKENDLESGDTMESDIKVDTMILSAQFWPIFREEKLQLPDVIQGSLEKYTKAFEALKGNRTLNWKTHLGLVDLELELKGRLVNISVTPVHATIIWHFQEKSTWTVDELSTVMQMPSSAIRRKAIFWQSRGILRETTTSDSDTVTLTLIEDDDTVTSQSSEVIMEDEAESAMASASDQREEEMQVIWTYIVGMLTNLETMTLERIHAMLKMFLMQGPSSSDCTMTELKAFLERQVKDQKLIHSSGTYLLPSNALE